VLKNTIRDSDEVCRLGGEEFLVICRNTSEEEGLLVAERLRRAVDGHVVEGNGFGSNVTISLGAASSEDFPAGFAAVLKGADLAVYEAKRSGRNRFSSASTLFRGAGSDDLTAGLGRESA
jgi:diguanylate cyclase (GGDEF)-like protein